MVASARINRDLTPREEAFARLVASGKNNTESYIQAVGYKGKRSTAKVTAHYLAQDPAVQAFIRELKERANESAILTRTEKRAILANLARKSPQHTTRISAIKVDNEMSGDNAAVKIEGELTLGVVLGSIKQVQPIVELTQEPERLAESSVELPELSNETFKATVVEVEQHYAASPAQAIPADSGPFAGEVAVFPFVSAPSPVKLTRTRSYDE